MLCNWADYDNKAAAVVIMIDGLYMNQMGAGIQTE